MDKTTKLEDFLKTHDFVIKIKKVPFNPKFTECWEWLGANNGNYAIVWYQRRSRLLHKIMYELTVKSVSPGKELDHGCTNSMCVNPYHLEEVTAKENVHRSNSPCGINSRKTVCKRGHSLLDKNNLHNRLDGSRDCKKCHPIRKQNRKRKKVSKC